MKFIETFGRFATKDILIIVDVQKSFRKFFSEMYVEELKKYCNNFKEVYQLFDNHIVGKHPDLDYLYSDDPKIPVHKDLYHFPNQKDIIEKRYNYDVDSHFYKKILSKDTFREIKEKEENNSLKRGDIFPTKEGTFIVFIGNKHRWFHVPRKLSKIFNNLKEAQSEKSTKVTIVGGADSECLTDITTYAESLGLQVNRDWKYIYTASSCPIK